MIKYANNAFLATRISFANEIGNICKELGIDTYEVMKAVGRDFRMSYIYGTRQFGVEDQGWVAWFTIATLLGKPITIYGDGKQVRDMLYVTDLVAAFDAFVQKRNRLHHGVYNMGGGVEKTMSLLELLEYLKEITGKRSKVSYDDWRPSDQKVYISDISKAEKELGWKSEVNSREGVKKLINWVSENKTLFA